MKGLFWGLLTIDLHYFTNYYPEENTKTKVKKFNTYIGGPATNAAITFQYLGGEAKLTTAIGKNSYNSMISEELASYQLDVVDLKAKEKVEPIFASVITNESSGARTIFSYLPPKATLNNDAKLAPLEYDIALFDGFYIETAIEKAKACREKGITTMLDGGSWKNNTDELLKYIDVAICSEDFVPPGITHQEDITAYLLNKGVTKAAITRGDKPIIVNEGEVNLLIEIPKTDVVDTLGAGDIFHGAFCYYYAHNQNFAEALEKAAQVASYSCQFHGPRAWMDKYQI
jgi:sugar/nucleoside kinase (ribokinase family)